MGFFIILIVIAILVMAILAHQAAKRRRDAMQQLADSMPGIRFSPGNDYSFDERYPFIAKLCEGDDRYAYNILSGQYRGHPVMVFDYHYETSHTDSDGDRTTTDHYFSFFILNFDGNFPELLITREGWGSKLVQFLGFDDIDDGRRKLSDAESGPALHDVAAGAGQHRGPHPVVAAFLQRQRPRVSEQVPDVSVKHCRVPVWLSPRILLRHRSQRAAGTISPVA